MISPKQREKLSQRLSIRADRKDTGAIPPQLQSVLTGGDLQKVVAALAKSRLLLPIFPHKETTDQGTDGDCETPEFQTLLLPGGGRALAAYAGMDALDQDFCAARPLPLASAKVAALAASHNLPMVVRPGNWVVPLPALHALAGGSPWLSPEADQQLARHLQELFSEDDCALISVRVSENGETEIEFAASSKENALNAATRISEDPVVAARCAPIRLCPIPRTVRGR
ncbi:MAG: SseB family protein [Actinomycetaceae bacterium]|nr:SseB family protein [Actinomycetaceae bacterium]